MARPLCIAALVWALGAPLAAQDGASHSEARARWSQMSRAEQDVMERRFQKLQRMNAVERRQLEERMTRLREWKREARERLPAETRQRLDSLAPGKREEIVTELMREDISRRGRDLLDRLPVEWRERIEKASPAERSTLLRELKEQNRGPGMERAFERLGKELSLPAEEVRRLKTLPRDEREAELLALNRRAVEKKVATRGLPEWMTAAEWKDWQRLPPRQFHERVQAKRREAGVRAGPARTRAAAEDGGARLMKLMRADAEARLELQDLTPTERRAELERRMKERVLEFLERSDGLATPEELERLRGLDGRELQEAARKLRETRKRETGPARRR